MTTRRFVSFAAPLGVCALLVGWIALSAANAQAATFSMLLYGVANLIVYTDALDFALRLYMRRRHTATARGTGRETETSIDLGGGLSPAYYGPAFSAAPGAYRAGARAPYAIVASVYNLGEHLDEFLEAYVPYRDRTWLVSDGSTDDTLVRVRQAGWRCFDDGVNRRKPAAIKRLLETLPESVEAVFVIDPDVHVVPCGAGSEIELDHFVTDFLRSGAAAACPRVMIAPDGFLARFQAFEYALAFRLGRRSLADYCQTSGVSLFRRDALQRALGAHSLSVYAEDFENAVLLLGRGERIYYDGRLVVSTEGPGAFGRWFSQRVGWYYGLLKVYTERFNEIWRIARRTPFSLYHYVLYLGGLTIAVHALKVLSALLLAVSFIGGFDTLFLARWLPNAGWINPVYFMSAVGGYLLLGAVALFTVVPREERAYIAPIVPLYLFYALVHIAPMTVGYANWITVKLVGRRLYRDHYEPAEDPSRAPVGAHLIARRLR
jgi:hypothetical protein